MGYVCVGSEWVDGVYKGGVWDEGGALPHGPLKDIGGLNYNTVTAIFSRNHWLPVGLLFSSLLPNRCCSKLTLLGGSPAVLISIACLVQTVCSVFKMANGNSLLTVKNLNSTLLFYPFNPPIFSNEKALGCSHALLEDKGSVSALYLPEFNQLEFKELRTEFRQRQNDTVRKARVLVSDYSDTPSWRQLLVSQDV